MPTKKTAVLVIDHATQQPVSALSDIALDIKSEWGKGLDAQFAIGRLLEQARSQFADDEDIGFGKWLAEQEFPFSRNTAWRLREASKQEPAVREFIASRPVLDGVERNIASVSYAHDLMLRKPKAENDETPIQRGEAPDERGFTLLRTGIHTLLGWQVAEDGSGEATQNGLLLLPTDQLAELKVLIEALAPAFKEAILARRSA